MLHIYINSLYHYHSIHACITINVFLYVPIMRLIKNEYKILYIV